MVKKQTAKTSYLQQSSLQASRIGFVFTAIYAITNGIYQAWKLLTPEVTQERWMIVVALLVFNVTLWQLSRRSSPSPTYYRLLLWLQALAYTAISAYSIYSERGMASNSIILFVIPIVIIALERSGKSLLLISSLCSATYAATAIKYFRNYPSEGYKVELYGGIIFYMGILYLISGLIWLLAKSKTGKQS